MIFRGAVLLAGAFLLTSCMKTEPASSSTGPKTWGKTAEGENVNLYTLSNSKGMQATVTDYGARIVTLVVPDRNGTPGNVTLGFDSLDGYQKENPYFGAIVGRYGNRIAKGRFTLDGVEYKLAVNNGANSLHGGLKGFDKRVWTARQDRPDKLELTYVSRDGEEGYPGNMSTTVVYTMGDDNSLRIDYTITTDKATVHNVTNHAYFNLAGPGNGDVLGHRIMIAADRFTPVDAGLIPTGELKPVEGTPFDFRQPHAIGERIEAKDQQIEYGKGYDHNWVLNGEMGALRPAVKVSEPTTGRVMEVLTTEPGVQFYTGNFLDGTLTGSGGKAYKFRYGFCLETQHYPDSPNHPDFPTTVIKPGEKYRSATVYKFSTEAAK